MASGPLDWMRCGAESLRRNRTREMETQMSSVIADAAAITREQQQEEEEE